MKGNGIGRVYRATWIGHLPETADYDDGPNYRTAEFDCRCKGDCGCEDLAEFCAKHQAARGPDPSYYRIRVYKIRKIRVQGPGREMYEDRDLVLIDDRAAGEQLDLAI